MAEQPGECVPLEPAASDLLQVFLLALKLRFLMDLRDLCAARALCRAFRHCVSKHAQEVILPAEFHASRRWCGLGVFDYGFKKVFLCNGLVIRKPLGAALLQNSDAFGLVLPACMPRFDAAADLRMRRALLRGGIVTPQEVLFWAVVHGTNRGHEVCDELLQDARTYCGRCQERRPDFYCRVCQRLAIASPAPMDMPYYGDMDAVYCAACHGRAAWLRCFLDLGCSPDSARYDTSALSHAVQNRSVECVQLLLERGASLERDKQSSPLDRALADTYSLDKGDLTFVRMLAAAGCKIRLCAKAYQSRPVVSELIQHLACGKPSCGWCKPKQ